MPPFYSKTKEHALLAEVIRQASKQGGYRLGRTAVQKVMYFLKALGVPMRYVFDIHYYGPYCSAISSDLISLLADEIINDESAKEEVGSRYAPASELDDLTSRFGAYLDGHNERIKSVLGLFATLPTQALELLATIDFFYRRERMASTGDTLRQKVLSEVRRAKESKFTDEQIQEAYDGLAEIGLVR